MRYGIVVLAQLALVACAPTSAPLEVGHQVAALTGSYTANLSWSGAGCAVCGEAASICNSGGTLMFFTDSTPVNSLVTSVTVDLSGITCGATTLSVLINGVTVGTVAPAQNCVCGSCDPVHSFTLSNTSGIPGWVYGGSNNVTWSSDASFCGTTATVTAGWASKGVTALSSSANPSVFGQSVTYTATVTAASGTATGTVAFTDTGVAIGSAALNGSGVATLTVTPSLGARSIVATYSGDANNLPSSASLTQTVTKADTATSLSSSANPSTVGQGVSFTATVSAVSPGAGTPTGTITFFDGATSLGSRTLNGSGQATLTLASLSLGSHSITAAYGGNANFNNSTSSATNQVVSQDAPTMAVSGSPNPSVLGGSVSFTATVSAAVAASGVPTGTVTFNDGATVLATVSLDAAGSAGYSISTLGAGSHTINAVYSGDSNHQGVSGSTTQVVNKGSTTTTLASTTNPSVFGQSVTLTATVTGPLLTPSGTVTFLDGATSLGTRTLNGAGQATLAIANLAVGAHSLSVQYGGDASFLSSSSSPLNQQVNQAATTTTLGSSSNPSIVGSSVTFTASVSVNAPGAGALTGTVTFKDGASSIGTVPLSGGVASFSTSGLAVGTHTITAQYGGDASFATSTSTGLSQVVNRDGVTATLQSSLNPSTFGASVTFTATLSAVGASGVPTGTVSFKDGATTLGSGVLNGAGVATFTTAALGVSTHMITAVYAGDTNHGSLTSSSLAQVVNPTSTTVTLVTSVNPSVLGQGVSFSTTVSSPAGTPTGTVTFTDGGSALGTASLSGGVASFTTSAVAVGTHAIVASYGGDASFVGGGSAPVNQVVGAASTTTSLSSSANPAFTTASVTFTATVAVVAPGAGTLTGTVTFSDGATILGEGTLDSAGLASFSTSVLSSGTHSITATFAGDSNFVGSASVALAQVINTGGVSASLVATPPTGSYGTMVTLAATVVGDRGTPTGMVRFTDGASTLGSATLDGNGVATWVVAALSVGNHTITAAYEGDAAYDTVTAQTTVSISKAATMTTLSATPNPANIGEAITLSARVTSNVSGVAGVVQFLDGPSSLGTAPVVGDTARLTVAALGEGDHVLSAVYAGNSSFASSTAMALTERVGTPGGPDGGTTDDSSDGCDLGGGSTGGRVFLLGLAMLFVLARGRRRVGG